MTKAVAFRFEGGVIFRNVRPLEVMIEEFKQKNIPYVHIDPKTQKYASWNLVLVFEDEETKQKYSAGEIEYKPNWLPGMHTQTQRINPLKAAKRAAARGRK
ncbi:MAG: hypothetical protein CSA26_08560 [Desulfobacterales bacterium]|nr:MAG: hypothetical protein CSA26_08560 [Desulfobacterales bacterium]